MEETLISNDKMAGGKTQSPLVNEAIRSKEVRLIDDEGGNHGVITTRKALELAYERGLDLVIVSPNQDPPVAKILDYGKYKFEAEKKAKEAKKKQHTVEIKEIKMRYKIDVHDYNVKINHIKKFIASGNKVKIVVTLRGREIQHSQLAFDLAKRIEADAVNETCIIEKNAGMEGKSLIMILAPATNN